MSSLRLFNKNNRLVYYTIPVVINITAIYFWHSETYVFEVYTFSLVFNTFIVSLYLIFCNASIKSIDFPVKAVCSFLSIGICVIIHYCSWRFATGRVPSFYSLTALMVFGEFVIAGTIVSFGLISDFLYSSRRRNK